MPKAAPRFTFGKQPEKAAWGHNGRSTTQRGYGWQHQKARKALLDAEPLCRMCRDAGKVTIAVVADHIVSLAQGGSQSIENLQPLCTSCHREKTLREARAGKWKG